MLDLIVFDFDGPLFDARTPRDDALEATIGEFASQFGRPQHAIRSTPLYDPRRTIRLVYAELDISEDHLLTIEGDFRKRLIEEERRRRIADEVEAMLSDLVAMGCRLAILSMRREENLLALVRHLGIAKYFGIVHGRDSSTVTKPDPQSLINIVEKVAVARTATLFVGDSDADIETAEAAQVGYLHAGWSREPRRDTCCNLSYLKRPGELVTLVRELRRSRVESNVDRLKSIVRHHPFSFFAGAGVSIESGVGAWQDAYLPVLSAHMPEGAIEGRQLPDVVQLIASRPESARLMFDEFREKFRLPGLRPGAYHLAMVRSGCATIWTTNYDELFERAHKLSVQDITTIRNDEELTQNFGNRRMIVKVNGDFFSARYDPRSLDWGIVLTEEQFDLSERERAEIWRYFEDEYRTSTLVFVGLSFDDPSLKRILSIAARKVMRTRNTHFFLSLMPRDLHRRALLLRQCDALRLRNIETVLFETADQLLDFVCHLALASVQPVVAFSGDNGGPDRSDGYATECLPGGILSRQGIEEVCGLMGETIAKGGFRVSSGHGPGVGVPAVVRAFRADRRLARFYLRTHGRSDVSREAPSIIFPTDELDEVRKQLIGSAHLLIACGGGSTGGAESGTGKEIGMALDAGVPVLLLPQAGGTVGELYDGLLTRVNTQIPDEKLRKAVVARNAELKALSEAELREYTMTRLASVVGELTALSMKSARSEVFDLATLRAGQLWA